MSELFGPAVRSLTMPLPDRATQTGACRPYATTPQGTGESRSRRGQPATPIATASPAAPPIRAVPVDGRIKGIRATIEAIAARPISTRSASGQCRWRGRESD